MTHTGILKHELKETKNGMAAHHAVITELKLKLLQKDVEIEQLKAQNEQLQQILQDITDGMENILNR